ncbi:uncharacterized protein Dvar_08530 [Desulfosarcina variabilis str. Montpellier]
MAKKFDSAIDKILDPQVSEPTKPETPKTTDTQSPKSTTPQAHIPTNTHLHKATNSQKEPTERLDAMIPQSLKWAMEDLVKETNRTRKRGNKTSMTAEITKAIEAHLKRT